MRTTISTLRIDIMSNMPAAHDAIKCSCSVSPSSPPDIADLPGGFLEDDLEPIQLSDFCDWNSDGNSLDVGGLGSPELRAACASDSPKADAADSLRERTSTRAPALSRHEARLLMNVLTGFEIQMQHNIVRTRTPMPLLRHNDARLVFTRRPTVMRAQSSFDQDLEHGRTGATRRNVGTSYVSLRAVHNHSIGQQIVADLANDPGLQCTTSALVECAHRLRA